ncbi:hypothetical protein MRB53_005318 [Persea americana]|uniref:Uncharacterized protein n=1 Tax=Persea americana TaxID=3435 RepID=A0ACC2MCZ1_PERAE|nr:hypothetical protein MRB53_005318 [Persea americana]
MASKVSSLLSTSLEFNWSMRVGTLISGRLNPLRNKDFICCCDDKDCFKGSALEEEPVPEEVTVIDDGWQALRVQNPGEEETCNCASKSQIIERSRDFLIAGFNPRKPTKPIRFVGFML